MEVSTYTKFISQKVNKIRWRPISKQVVQQPNIFVTGSWDDYVNKVSLWCLESPSQTYSSFGDPTQSDIGEPQLLCEVEHRGDVTDLQYITGELIVASSSRGSVSVYKHHPNSQTMSTSNTWDSLHHHGSTPSGPQCSCTSLAVKGTDTVVTVGEDGRLNVINLEHRQPVRTIEKADSCTLNAVTFLKQFEVATVNSIGQLKSWDLRQSSDEPARMFHMEGERLPLHCLDKHPTQPHILVTGGQDGTLCIWDMRQDRYPVTLLSAHSADMWDVCFHPTHPDNLFTCSEDGTVWHWDASSITSQTAGTTARGTPGNASMSVSLGGLNTTSKQMNTSVTSAWLATDTSKHRLDVTDLLTDNSMPVNSIDVQGNTLLCGTDGEQVYVVRNLIIK